LAGFGKVAKAKGREPDCGWTMPPRIPSTRNQNPIADASWQVWLGGLLLVAVTLAIFSPALPFSPWAALYSSEAVA
jgi:hypothetical protein